MASFAIKGEVRDVRASRFAFSAQKTMYGGKRIGAGDVVYIFASGSEGGEGLIARGVVTSADVHPKPAGVDRWTPRVSVAGDVTAAARKPLGRAQLKRFIDWSDGRPETELNFKFYRQATDKIVGVSDATATFLDGFF